MTRTEFVRMTAAQVLRPAQSENAQRDEAKHAKASAERLADELGMPREPAEHFAGGSEGTDRVILNLTTKLEESQSVIEEQHTRLEVQYRRIKELEAELEAATALAAKPKRPPAKPPQAVPPPASTGGG